MILNNGETLAYLGDSVYELKIREYLLKSNINDVNQIHKQAISYTSGEAQARFMLKMREDNFLTEEELTYFKRGRNSNHSKNGRSIKVTDYKNATGFEAMIGFLYLEKRFDRIDEIISYIIDLERKG